MLAFDLRTQAAVAAGNPQWSELPKTAKEARNVGSTHYFTGKPCKRGHISPRPATRHVCMECDRAAAREYYRRPEVNVRERVRSRDYNAQYFRRAEVKEWFNEYMREYNQRRAAAKRKAAPLWLTPEHISQMQAIHAEAARLTEATGILHHVDHIIPISHPDVQGLHVPWNLQILTAFENQSKHNAFDGTHENQSWRAKGGMS